MSNQFDIGLPVIRVAGAALYIAVPVHHGVMMSTVSGFAAALRQDPSAYQTWLDSWFLLRGLRFLSKTLRVPACA